MTLLDTDPRLPGRVERALAAIDARNAADPNRISVRGASLPKELAHAGMASTWIQRLRPDAGEALVLAARAHHIRRWAIPRDSYPDGRTGYLLWRKALQDLHVAELTAILEAEGFDRDTIEGASRILRKQGLAAGDPDVQAFEDALCLVFLETQLLDIAARLDHEKTMEVLRKTLRKMSAAATGLAQSLDLAPEARELLEAAAGVKKSG